MDLYEFFIKWGAALVIGGFGWVVFYCHYRDEIKRLNKIISVQDRILKMTGWK